MNAEQLWQSAVGELELKLSRPIFDTWIKNTQAISLEDGVLVVTVHSAYAKDWLENRLYDVIHRTVSDIARRTTSVRFIVRRGAPADVPAEGLFKGQGALEDPVAEAEPLSDLETGLNPKYSFESFIVGHSNRLAHAGCLAVAEKPGLAYNPLFIYGGVGLGKTHLLHAVGNYAQQRRHRVLYVSTEKFANELINAIRTRTTEAFRAKYRTIEVLLLDDVQFLINKEATQEEFFHTFNDLYQRNRQIVLSSDRPPKAFMGLEERLRSRFEWGLIADIQPPDLETRIAILSSKAERQDIRVPEEVIVFLAQQIQSNIRELEGALTRVLAVSRMLGQPLTVQTAKQALSSSLYPARDLSPAEIKKAVAAYFGIDVGEIEGRRRSRPIAMARQVAMYLMRELTAMSLPQIGQALGGRDHTTIMHGIDKVAALFEKDEQLRRQLLDLKTKLYANGGGRWEAIQESESRPRGAR